VIVIVFAAFSSGVPLASVACASTAIEAGCTSGFDENSVGERVVDKASLAPAANAAAGTSTTAPVTPTWKPCVTSLPSDVVVSLVEASSPSSSRPHEKNSSEPPTPMTSTMTTRF
jgi:hypothetical protein